MSKKLNLWTITDGSQGMVSQVKGLAKHFCINFTEKEIRLKWPWSFLQPGILPINKKIFNKDFFIGELPNMTISCGRKSVYASLYLKNILKEKLISIHIQNPKVNYKNFDFIISPNHDQIFGKNVINSIGALHKFTLSAINQSKSLFEVPKNKKIVTIILGGENNHYKFDYNDINKLIKKLNNLNVNENKYYFIIISSRRTNLNFINIIKKNIKTNGFIWDNTSENPYLYSLKIADYFIITSDSTSMISEASITGKPIFIFHLPYKRKSKRMEYFHREFSEKGITKPFTNDLFNWTYNSLDESKRIAGILNTRILKQSNE